MAILHELTKHQNLHLGFEICARWLLFVSQNLMVADEMLPEPRVLLRPFVVLQILGHHDLAVTAKARHKSHLGFAQF